MKTRRAAFFSFILASAVLSAAAVAQEDLHLNRTIGTLAEGKPAFGIFSGDFSLANARPLAASDLDFVFIDMEHGSFDLETLQALLRVTVGYWNDAGISSRDNE